MQVEDPKSKEDSAPRNGFQAPARNGPGTPHLHFWSDVTVPASDYVEQVCNGDKWSPLCRDYVFPKGCGARRRILKEAYPRNPTVRHPGAACPPDSAWEIVGPGKP